MAKKASPNYEYYMQEWKELEQLRLILAEIDRFSFSNVRANSQEVSTKRRSKLGLYGDILSAIQNEATNGKVKLTRVQFRSNTSYDKLIKYLNELEKKDLIEKNPLRITDKGMQFLREYSKIRDNLEKISKDFL